MAVMLNILKSAPRRKLRWSVNLDPLNILAPIQSPSNMLKTARNFMLGPIGENSPLQSRMAQ